METDALVKVGSTTNQRICFEGACCGHAILTVKIGIYHCPFDGWCFKKLESQRTLPCVFWSDVSCSFRKNGKSGIMNRCLQCFHYKRFEREMDEEDAREAVEIEEIWKNPEKYGYSSG